MPSSMIDILGSTHVSKQDISFVARKWLSQFKKKLKGIRKRKILCDSECLTDLGVHLL
jgi:hypothetical protein